MIILMELLRAVFLVGGIASLVIATSLAVLEMRHPEPERWAGWRGALRSLGRPTAVAALVSAAFFLAYLKI